MPLRLLLVLALLALAGASPATAAVGGPDAFGYTWRDDADGCDASVPAFGAGASTLPGANIIVGPVSLGFTGTYFGAPVTQVWMSPNGYVTFTDQGPPSVGPQTMPNATPPNHLVGPFWTGNGTGEITYEATPAFFHVRWVQTFTLRGTSETHLFIYPDGRLRMAWVRLPSFGVSVSIGYEDAAGARGRTFYTGSPIEPGFTLVAGRSLCILPPARLDCAGPAAVSCGESRALTLPASLPSNATTYACTAVPLPGNERVVRLDVPEPSEVTVSISNPALTLLKVGAPPDCSEYSCTAAGGTVLNHPVLNAGAHHYVVDKATTGGGDAFTFTSTCTPIAQPLACGATVAGDTTGGRLIRGSHLCLGGDHSGAEAYHRVSHAGGTLVATLTAAPALDVLILDANDLSVCLAGGDTEAAAFSLPAGDYMVAVDGPPGSEGPYSLTVTCGTQVRCAPLEPTVLACASSVAGDTAGGQVTASRYSCSSGSFPGPERVYELQVPPGTVDLIVSLDTTADLGVFVLGACDEGACLGGGARHACMPAPAAGTYLVVVDSATAAGGAYTLDVSCGSGASFDRWITCTNARTTGAAPGCGIPNPDATTAATTAARMWSFSDGAFCVSNPGHKAYPFFQAGQDCTFAMYVVAECGKTMSIPLCDNETGDMRIWDVFAGRYVDLTATSDSGGCVGGPWTQAGTQIQWEDCAGTNCFWNTVITSVSFQGSPTLCGVYRVEFTNWGGNVWDLFANCSGRNEPGFMIYDNLCEAVQAFSPKPELSIVNPVLLGTCPEYTLEFELHDTGCAPASDFCVRIWEEAVGGDVDHTPASLCDLSIGAGEVLRFSVPVSLTAATSQALRMEVDPEDSVLECSEAPSGSVVACGAEQGAREYRVPICDGCVSLPAGATVPDKACYGAPATYDATGSTVTPCVMGVEYAWTAAPSPPAPGATCGAPDELECWSDLNQTLAVTSLAPPPGERHVTLYLWTRCAEDPACLNDTPYPLAVEVHRPPELGLADALDMDPCQLGLVVSWEPATFHHDPGLGPGTYNVYRVDATGDLAADCARALAPANLLVSDLAASSYIDGSTLANAQYVYVIEAEDREPANPCAPPGPLRGGATDTACIALLVGAPATDALDLTAPYPGVGNSVRATDGDEAGVAFAWADVRQDPAREYFRVVRATAPEGPYTRIADLLAAPAFDDRLAPDALYFYEFKVIDSCGGEALASFPRLPQRPPGCRDVQLRCGQDLDADTRACTNALASHPCDPGQDATGLDRTHEAWTESDGDVTFRLDAPGTNLRLAVWDTTMTRCLGADAAQVTVAGARANTRFIVVVDSPPGDEAAYRISMSCP